MDTKTRLTAQTSILLTFPVTFLSTAILPTPRAIFVLVISRYVNHKKNKGRRTLSLKYWFSVWLWGALESRPALSWTQIQLDSVSGMLNKFLFVHWYSTWSPESSNSSKPDKFFKSSEFVKSSESSKSDEPGESSKSDKPDKKRVQILKLH